MVETMTIQTITPEIAAEYLQRNTKNRNLSKASVDRLAGEMLRGEWILNGETIKFDREGNLVDGQHRLAAIITSNTTIQTFVVRGIDGDISRLTVDQGKRRTLADILKLRGEKHYKPLASAIGWAYKLEHGPGLSAGTFNRGIHPTPLQAVAYLEMNPGLRESYKYAGPLYRSLRFPEGLATALYYVLSNRSREDADYFFGHLLSGAGLSVNDPILVLRRRLERLSSGGMNIHGNRIYATEIAALTIKAWNAFRKGEEVSRLVWFPGGSRREKFPVIL